MKTIKSVSLQAIVSALLVAIAPLARASTVWDGPTTDFAHTDENGLADQMTRNVAITRGTEGGGLFNSAQEDGATGGISPVDTEWAVGTLDDYTNNALTFGPCPLEAGSHPPGYVGTTFVVHLISDDIYLSLTLTGWGAERGSGDHTFSYTRTTAVVAPTLAVIITNPVGGAVFAAPANVSIAVSNSVSGGTVTNVQFFTNNVSLGSVTTAPFSLTVSNLAAGAYALKAVATSAGISATSAVVNITVDAPPTVSITNPTSGAVFSAPANLTIKASASDSDGTVTNVRILIGSVVLTNVTTSPYVATTNNVGTNSYTLSAIAFDNNGVKKTNSISISVVTPVTVSLGTNSVKSASTNFQFSYAANVGLSYVIQFSTNLAANWISLVTNVAASNPVVFVDIHATNRSGYYRVGRLPNP